MGCESLNRKGAETKRSDLGRDVQDTQDGKADHRKYIMFILSIMLKGSRRLRVCAVKKN